METFRTINDAFWSAKFWLPPNITWDDMAPGSRPDVRYANYRDLNWVLPLTLIFIALRYLLEIFCFAPLGKSIGIKSTKLRPPPPNQILERAYNKNQRLNQKTVVGLVKQVDLTERQIERWWRLRRAQDKPSSLDKFCETSWKSLYYTYSFTYGTIILWDKPWLWDVKSCWYDYPHHSIDNGIWWYFSVTMAFYFSLTVTQFFETKRKDFWQMFAHHLISLSMMYMSWLSNFHRQGTLFFVIHDCADLVLESDKSLKYAKYHKICDCLFVVFLVTWVATRLVFYPRIVYGSIFEAPGIIEMFPLTYVNIILQVALLCLHVFWSNIIFQMARSYVSAGKVDSDPRSSSSEASDSPINAENEIRQTSSH